MLPLFGIAFSVVLPAVSTPVPEIVPPTTRFATVVSPAICRVAPAATDNVAAWFSRSAAPSDSTPASMATLPEASVPSTTNVPPATRVMPA